jgi:hypothetical protein
MNMRATHGLCRFFWLRRHARPDLRRRDRVGARRRRRRRLARRARPRCRRDARPLAQGGACRLRPRGAARVHTDLSRGRRRGGQGLRVGGEARELVEFSRIESSVRARPTTHVHAHVAYVPGTPTLGQYGFTSLRTLRAVAPPLLTRTEECGFWKGFDYGLPP